MENHKQTGIIEAKEGECPNGQCKSLKSEMEKKGRKQVEKTKGSPDGQLELGRNGPFFRLDKKDCTKRKKRSIVLGEVWAGAVLPRGLKLISLTSRRCRAHSSHSHVQGQDDF
jgi:hypothetical protein